MFHSLGTHLEMNNVSDFCFPFRVAMCSSYSIILLQNSFYFKRVALQVTSDFQKTLILIYFHPFEIVA